MGIMFSLLAFFVHNVKWPLGTILSATSPASQASFHTNFFTSPQVIRLFLNPAKFFFRTFVTLRPFCLSHTCKLSQLASCLPNHALSLILENEICATQNCHDWFCWLCTLWLWPCHSSQCFLLYGINNNLFSFSRSFQLL